MPGIIAYRGPSVLDGSPIVCIVVWARSSNDANVKTGHMLQTYIIRSDMHPVSALNSGADSAVCGDCKRRPFLGGDCYVEVWRGVGAVYRALIAGSYPESLSDASDRCAGELVRLGTYGDPMAVPAYVWDALLARAAGRTGYTHQWLNPDVPAAQREAISALCMASADTPTEREMADSIGLRTFRGRRADEPLMPGEFICPASKEAGKRKTCAECGACDGTRENRAASPVIIVHGSKVRRVISIKVAA